MFLTAVVVFMQRVYSVGIAGSSSGRTLGSGPSNRGSNPCPAAEQVVFYAVQWITCV